MQKVDKFANKYFFLIPLLVILVYANSLGNGFVLDDPSQVLNNVNVTSFNLTRIFLGSSFGVDGGTQGIYYKPLMSASYALLYNIFGSGAWSFHLLQILLQAVNSLLVFFIFKRVLGVAGGKLSAKCKVQSAKLTDGKRSFAALRMTGGRGRLKQGFTLQSGDPCREKPCFPSDHGAALAFWLALVFAVHPLNSESVLYISALQDPLFFFFGGLAFLVSTGKKLNMSRAAISGVLVLLSLLSKETGVVFIPLIVLYTVFFNFEKKQRGDASWLFVVLGVVFAFYFLLRLAAVGLPVSQDNPYPIMRLDLVQRLINLPEEVFYYLRNFFYPHDFAVAQHWVVKAVDWKRFYLPLVVDFIFLAALGVIGVLAWRARNTLNITQNYAEKTRFHPAVRRPLQGGTLFLIRGSFAVYLFFLGWFAAGMVLHLNLIPLDVTVADRWFYFPSVGLLGICGVAVLEIAELRRTTQSSGSNPSRTQGYTLKHRFILVTAGVLILVLTARTFVRTFDWRDGLSLDRRDINFSRHSFPLENNYAFELINVGKWDEALVHAKRSTELGPWWWLNWNNLGVVYRHLGYVQKDPKLVDLAIASFRRGAVNTNTFFQPHENLAETLLNLKGPKAAIAAIEQTNRKMGLNARLLFLLALAQYKDGDMKAASESAKRAAALGDEKGQLLYNGMVNKLKIEISPTQY